MSKFTKRLLSLLVVIAMVVAMAPTTGLPAVEVKAAEQTTNAELVLDADGKGWCPACQAPVQWTLFDGKTNVTGIKEELHYYLADDTDFIVDSVNIFTLTTGGKLCFHLNGHTLTVLRSAGARIWVNSGCTGLNIFGEDGGIVNNGYNTIQHNGGYVNVYGGTYTDTTENNKFATTSSSAGGMTLQNADVGIVELNGAAAKVILQGTTVVDNIHPTASNNGAVQLAEDWTGTATTDIPVENLSKISYTGDAPSGIVTLATGEKLAYANGGVVVSEEDVCSACNESVAWEVFDGTKQYTGIATHKHFYLAEDTHYTVDSVNMITLTTGGAVCFNLNGHTLTVDRAAGARIWVNTGSVGLNIFGEGGGIVNNGYNTIQHNAGYVNVYGGTYTDTTEANKFATTSAAGGMMLQNVDAGVIAYEGLAANVELKGSTVVDSIKQTVYEADGETVRGYGALKLASDWTGTATVAIPVENLSKISYTGEAPTGTVTLTTGETLAYKNGTVYVPYTEECPVCGEVEWELFDGTQQFTGINTHRHFYLAEDTTYTFNSVNMISVTTGGNVCFNLNGHKLTVGNADGKARFWMTAAATDGVLNIFANGGEIDYANRAIIQAAGGTTNIYGGTYGSSTGCETFADVSEGVLNIDGATVNGNVVNASWKGVIKLAGEANVGKITLGYASPTTENPDRVLYGKLELDSTWTGTATLDIPADALSASTVSYTGVAPTGKLTLATGEKLAYKNGTLVVTDKDVCAACNESVAWEVFDGTKAISSNAEKTTTHRHLYLAADTSYDGAAISANLCVMGEGGSICLDLNGKTLNVADARLWLSGSATEDSELNIIANGGTVNYTKRAFIQQNVGTVKVIGGTYNPSETEDFIAGAVRNVILQDVTTTGNLSSDSTANKFVLKGATTVGTITLDFGTEGKFGKLELDESWTGAATLNVAADALSAEKIFYTGNAPTGTLTLASGEVLEYEDGTVVLPLPAFEEDCPVCGDVEWEIFDGTQQFTGVTGTRHFYLAKDTTYTFGSVNMMTLAANAQVCFHLNGHKLTIGNAEGSARFWQSTGATGSVLNIFGEGGEIDYANRAIIQANSGTTNIYGGTYGSSTGCETFADVTEGVLNIDGATVNGNVVNASWKGVIKLAGEANVGKITLGYASPTTENPDRVLYGKLELDSSWSGEAVLDMDVSELTDGKVSTSVVSYDKNAAAPTGKLYLASGERLGYKDGTLYTARFANCEACGEEVEWEEFDGTKQYTGIATHRHFYLTDDTSYTFGSINMMTIGAGGSVCFDLNGKTLTIAREGGARIWLTGGAGEGAELNIIANGGAINYRDYPIIQQNVGAVNIIGGTYTPTGIEDFATTATRNFLIQDATINANLTSASAATHFILTGATTVGKLNINAGGKIELKSDWTGTATLDMAASDLTNGRVPAECVFYSDRTPTGTLKLASGETLVYQYGQLMLDGYQTPAPTIDCPVCGEAVTWTEYISGAMTVAENGHAHYYLGSDINTDAQGYTAEDLIVLGANQKLCLNLNGHKLTTGSRMHVYGNDDANTALNIFGGEYVFTAANAKTGIFLERNVLKLADGTFTYAPAKGKSGTLVVASRYPTFENAAVNGKVSLNSKHASLNLWGTSTVSEIDFCGQDAQVRLRSGWAGSAALTLPEGALVDGVVNASRVEYDSTATGKLSLSTGEQLVYLNGVLTLARVAPCAACGEDVTWEIFDGAKQYLNIANHRHFYLADDTEYTFDSANMITITAGGHVCFDLNGKTLTIAREGGARMWLGGAATDGVLNIIANGGAINYQAYNILQVGAGTANIIGGTYTATDGFETFASVGEGTLNLDGADVNGNVVTNSWKAVTKLTGNTTVDKVTLAYTSTTGNTLYGKLELVDGWSGTATVDLDNTHLVDGKLDTAKVSYSGVTPTGKLYLSTGEELVCQAGAVRLPLQIRTATCSVCGEEKEWVAYDGTRMLGITGEQHLYLADDLTITSGASMMTVLGNANVCFDLNGHKLTTQGYIELNDGETSTTKWDEATNTSSGETEEVGVFNLIANGGSVEYTGYSTFIKHVEATLNIIGGTYTATQSDQSFFAVSRMLTLEDATINGDITLDSVRSMLTLKGNTNIDGEVIVLDDQRVHREPFMVCVDSSFTGNAVLNVPAVCMVDDNGADLLLPTIENGALQTARYIANGDFAGNVTLTNGAKLYNTNGALTLGIAKVAGETTTWYKTAAEAVAAYTAEDFAAGNYLRIYGGEVNLTGASYYIDNAGFDLTVNGTGKLYAMDSDNAEDFEGFGSWTVAAGIEIVRDFTVGGIRYIVITENGVTSAHALVITLSGLTINTSDAGLYYDAQYKCDDTLAAKISTYGIIASVKDMPGAKMTSGDQRTELHTFAPDWNHEVLSDSSTVYGIFKDTRTAAQNAKFGQMDIYANPYIELDVDGDGNVEVIVADTENVGKKAGNAWSLYDALKHINDNWTAFAGDRIAVRDFYNAWAAKGMSEYAADLGNIIAAEGSKVATPLKSTDIAAVNAADMTEDARRAEVLGFMDKTMSFAWTPNVETDHYNNKGDGDYFIRTYEVGKVYGGTPYVTNTQGNLYTMMEYYDETTGILDLSGGMDTIKMFSNQCSGSVYWAWQRVCASAKFDSTATMVAANGCLPVGPYTYDTTISNFYAMNETGANGNPTATDVIINANGVQTMYESYALTKPADGLVTFIDGNNHARMVSGTPNVVRNSDGTIDGVKSTLTYIDQSGVMEQTETQSNGVTINLIGDHNVTKTFAQLIVEGYIPFTFAELNGGEVAQSSTTISAQANATVAQLAAATVSSNYGISDVTYVVKDAQGNEVYRELFVTYTTMGLHNYSFKLGAKNMIDTDALAFFADGQHTVEISVRIGTGEKPVVYTGTLAG